MILNHVSGLASVWVSLCLVVRTDWPVLFSWVGVGVGVLFGAKATCLIAGGRPSWPVFLFSRKMCTN